MNSEKILKSCLCFVLLPLITCAEEAKPTKERDYYFATAKVGIDQPVTHGGNANIDNADTTYTAGLEFGKKFMEIYGLSFEYMKIGNNNFTVNNISQVGTKTFAATWSGKSDLFMVNASVDVIKNSLITPYIKFGMGASVNRSSNYVVNVSDSREGTNIASEVYNGATYTKFAWQAGLGINVTSNELFDVDMGYMFVDRGQMATNKGYVGTGNEPSNPNAAARTTNLRDHTVTIGLKAKF